MSHTHTTPAATPATRGPRPVARTARPALRARHWSLVLAPTVAGVLTVVGAAADPAVGKDGAALFQAYAENPAPLQAKSVAYHFAYLLWGATALGIVSSVRRRGSWLANVAGVLALLGISTMPGFLIVDFYDSAIGREFGVDGVLAVSERMDGMWGLHVLVLSGVLPFLVALPVTVLAAWRGGVLPWWAAVSAPAGIGVGFFLIGFTIPGALVATAGFLILSVGLARTRAGLPATPDPRIT